MKNMSIILFLLRVLITQSTPQDYNPVIGVLVFPIPAEAAHPDKGYIFAYYIRWLEAAGAKVIPIYPWYTHSQLDEIIPKLNGILFPGGDRAFKMTEDWERVSIHLFRWTIELNDSGTHFPLWSTCLGYEFLSVVLMGKDDRSQFQAENFPSPITIVDGSSRLFTYMSEAQLRDIQVTPSTAQFHHKGIGERQYNKYEPLRDFFSIVATGLDKEGKEFINMVEGYKYPVYGTQFHPEKVGYDRDELDDIPQNLVAIRFSQSLGNFFIQEARMNDHVMSSDDRVKYGVIDTYESLPEKDKNGRYIYVYKK
jgi:gamma-glutamyl hydrolase